MQNSYTIFHDTCLRLAQATTYPKTECEALVARLMAWHFGVGKVDILVKKTIYSTPEKYAVWENHIERLMRYEPMQYLMEEVFFCDKRLIVNPNVLIPRPETEEWVQTLIARCRAKNTLPTHIIDVCTGSGCIAVALATAFGQARTEAWDISTEALKVAQQNAENIGVQVDFKEIDALNAPLPAQPLENLLMVSNPPYIPTKEQALMQRNVLDYEPAVALFVPDERPCLFYERLAVLAKAYQPCLLMVEIHEDFSEEVIAIFAEVGFHSPEVHIDFRGKARTICWEKAHSAL